MISYRWLHYRMALPLLKGFDVPKALGLFDKATQALGGLDLKKDPQAILAALGPDLFSEVVAFILSINPADAQRLALIAGSTVEDLEAILDDPAKDAEAMQVVGRLSAEEVVARVLFFIGMRGTSSTSAPGSSPSATTSNPGAPPISDSSSAT